MSSKSNPYGLTDKQFRFCEEYMVDLNATQAAIRAGYSKKTSMEQGYQLLHKTSVLSQITDLKKEASEKIKITEEEILEELLNWAYSDITETLLLTPEQLKELPPEIRRLITKVKHTKKDLHDKTTGKVIETINTVELHFVSKEKAMEMIHKHTGFYEKDNSQKSSPVNINEADTVVFRDYSHEMDSE